MRVPLAAPTHVAIPDLGIDADVEAPLGRLGRVTQQMIAVARAAASDASVVIMDEPTASLEAREVETLFRVIEHLRAAGVAIVYVSHRLDELYRLCDSVSVLRDGRVVHAGPLAELPGPQLVAAMLGRELLPQTRRHTSPDNSTDTSEEAPVLSIERITRHGVLRDVSLAVRPGEVVGLGGLLGARIGRRLSPAVLRAVIVVVGLAAVVKLLA